MRTSTAILALVGLLAAGGLIWSARRASVPVSEDGRRVYRLAAWGGVEEIGELQTLVVDPVNTAASGFQVRLMPIPSDYHTKLGTMVAGGSGPELFYLSHEYVAAFAEQGALLELTDLVKADASPATDLGDYYPSVLDQYRRGGRLYGLPWIAQPVILYCNAEMFRRAGVALPDGSWNWARFVQAGRALTKDADGDGRIDQWGFVLNGWPPSRMWVWQNGAELIDPRTGRLRLTDPRVCEAIDAYAGLIHRDRIAPPLSVVAEAGFSEMFRARKVAMFMGGSADDLDRIEGLDVVCAEIPAGPTGIRATFAWSAGLHLSPAVADRREAFEAYRRVLDGIQRWKIPAPRKSLAARLEQFEPRKAAAASVIRASMRYMRAPPASARQIEFETLYREQFEDEVLRTGRRAAELAPAAANVLEKLR